MARPEHGQFPTTRWSMVLEARSDDAAKGRILEDLFKDYWQPLYAFARYLGVPPSDAEDTVQGLFAHLLDRDFLHVLDPEKGRLRNYLRTALRHYLSDQYQHDAAIKRGGPQRPVDLDTAVVERTLVANPEQSPEHAYDRLWAVQLMENAFQRLRQEFEDGRRSGPFALVEQYFSLDGAVAYEDLAPKFKMSVAQLKSFLHRARLRFRELVEAEVAQTVAGGAEDVRDELAYLRSLLSA